MTYRCNLQTDHYIIPIILLALVQLNNNDRKVLYYKGHLFTYLLVVLKIASSMHVSLL